MKHIKTFYWGFCISNNFLCAFKSNKGKNIEWTYKLKINKFNIYYEHFTEIYLYTSLQTTLPFMEVVLWGKLSLVSSTSYLIYYNGYWWHICSCLLQEECHLTKRCSTYIKRQPQSQSTSYPFWSKNRAWWKQTRAKVGLKNYIKVPVPRNTILCVHHICSNYSA